MRTNFDNRLMPAGRLFDWLSAYPGQWMVLVWVPIMMTAPVMHAVATADPGAWAMATGVTLGFAATVIVPRSRWRHAQEAGEILLVVLAGMVCAGVVNFGFDWISGFALLAIAAGVAIGSSRALAVIIFITVAGTVLVAALGGGPDRVVATLLTTFLAGFGNFVVHHLVAVSTQLRRTRQQLALAAVDRERVRFSRDLHDLLGHTLSVIVVKAEAVRRLAEPDPAAAAEHARDIEEIGRRALSEVREAVGGYRNTTLTGELDRARRALEAAQVNVTIDWETGHMDDGTEELLCWIVREGTTNVVRHAGARHCSLSITEMEGVVSVEISDDGSTSGPVQDGAGLAGLRERLGDAGGTLIVETTSPGFRLAARIPKSGSRAGGDDRP